MVRSVRFINGDVMLQLIIGAQWDLVRRIKMKECNFVQRSCPVCNRESNAALVHEQEFAVIESVTFLEGYKVVCCNYCGAVYADNIPPQSDFENYYSEQSKYENISAIDFGVRENYADLLYRALSKNGSVNMDSAVLDIGCGLGGFLYVLKKRGFRNLEGIDPSLFCVEHIVNEYDIRCSQGAVSTLDNYVKDRKELFDVIILTGVLEHLVNVYETCKNVSKLLRSGGVFFVTVPCVSFFNPLLNGPYQEFSVEHINYFHLESLLNLMGMHGFELILMDSSRADGIADFVFRKTNKKREIIKELQSLAFIKSYIASSESLDSQIHKLITAAQSESKVVVWGTGTLTMRLLAAGILDTSKIEAFVDSNKHYIGGSFKGVPVISPKQVKAYSLPILISSFVWNDSIMQVITEELKLKNKVISLTQDMV